MKAIFSPGPSYSDPEVRKYAGWVKILDLYKEALDELGFDVFIPQVPKELIDGTNTVSKITSYDREAWDQIYKYRLIDSTDLFMGPPGYSLLQLISLMSTKAKKIVWVWNNADWYRDEQLAGEYKRFNSPYDLSLSWRRTNQNALLLSDHVLACSPWVKKTHSSIVPPEKISIAFWGVDSQRFTPATQKPDIFRILFVGGDPIRKGLIYLLEALQGENDVVLRPYELWIVGCAPLKDPPPHWKQFGMIPHENIPHIYQQCSTIILPTLEDGIALAIQESMSSGLIAITSPETAEVFEDGISGIKVPYRDPKAIYDALISLKSNPDMRRGLKKQARLLAEKQTWGKTKEDVKEVIERVMKDGNLPFESEMPWLK